MWSSSPRFRDALTGSHEVITRCVLSGSNPFFTADPPTNPDPRFSTTMSPLNLRDRELPVIDGDVEYLRDGEIRSTATVIVPGEWWERAQPWGASVFLQRGIDFGDGTREYVPLGHFIIRDVEQDTAPDGPVVLTCVDRSLQVIQNRTPRVYQPPEGATHRQVFQRLINGVAIGGEVLDSDELGAYSYRAIPITWAAGVYDPDTTIVVGRPVIEDGDSWAFLRELAADRDCVLRFDESGSLRIESGLEPTGPPVFTVRGGQGGSLVRAARAATREGVYNIVSAYGSDPEALTGRWRRRYVNSTMPQQWSASYFGQSLRYFASPLLRNATEADAAANALMLRTVRRPSALDLEVVPNPALRPNDLIRVELGRGVPTEDRVIDKIKIPLTGDTNSTITTLPEFI